MIMDGVCQYRLTYSCSWFHVSMGILFDEKMGCEKLNPSTDPIIYLFIHLLFGRFTEIFKIWERHL